MPQQQSIRYELRLPMQLRERLRVESQKSGLTSAEIVRWALDGFLAVRESITIREFYERRGAEETGATAGER